MTEQTLRYVETPADFPSRETLLSMSGMEFLQAMLDGRVAAPAMARTMGFALTAVEPGRIVFRGRASIQHTNPMGGVHGGWYGSLLDSALGCAVMSGVPRGHWYTTLEYKVNLTRALPLDTEVGCVGLLDHIGRTTAVAHAEIRGLDGKLYATGNTTCLIMG